MTMFPTTIILVAPSTWPAPIVPGSLMPSGTTYVIANNEVTVEPMDAATLLGLGFTLILPTVNSNVGSFKNSNITVDAYGRITAASGSSNGAVAATAGAATLNTTGGTVTSEALTGALGYTLTLSNTNIQVSSTLVVVPVAPGATLNSVSLGLHSAVIIVSMSSLTGTISFPFILLNS